MSVEVKFRPITVDTFAKKKHKNKKITMLA